LKFVIAVLSGDGVGPDVIKEAQRALETIGQRFGHQFDYKPGFIGGIAIDKFGTALPEETLETCRKCDAVMLGAVGGPKWDNPNAKTRPEAGLLAIRKDLKLFANLRPVKMLWRTQPASSRR
jgi:3-isopropylmalate dehydrogenase